MLRLSDRFSFFSSLFGGYTLPLVLLLGWGRSRAFSPSVFDHDLRSAAHIIRVAVCLLAWMDGASGVRTASFDLSLGASSGVSGLGLLFLHHFNFCNSSRNSRHILFLHTTTFIPFASLPFSPASWYDEYDPGTVYSDIKRLIDVDTSFSPPSLLLARSPLQQQNTNDLRDRLQPPTLVAFSSALEFRIRKRTFSLGFTACGSANLLTTGRVRHCELNACLTAPGCSVARHGGLGLGNAANVVRPPCSCLTGFKPPISHPERFARTATLPHARLPSNQAQKIAVAQYVPDSGAYLRRLSTYPSAPHPRSPHHRHPNNNSSLYISATSAASRTDAVPRLHLRLHTCCTRGPDRTVARQPSPAHSPALSQPPAAHEPLVNGLAYRIIPGARNAAAQQIPGGLPAGVRQGWRCAACFAVGE